MRIVSLACSHTEIVCALGCADYLVGADDHSDRPVKIVDLPRVGPDLQIDVAAVAQLEPDLVLASLTVPGHEKVIEKLEVAGLPYLVREPVSLRDIYDDILVIAQALNVPERGEALVNQMCSAFAEKQTSPRHPKLLVQWWNRPTISPGKLSWVTDLIEAAGGQNPLGREAVKSRPLSDEEVKDINPDAIILSWCGVAFDKYRPNVIYRNPLWQEVKAVKNKRVFCVPEAHLGRPSPGLLEGFRALKDIVQTLGSHSQDIRRAG